jgi:hypothetical protein
MYALWEGGTMNDEPREGLEEYARTLDLKPEEVVALLDSALAEEAPPESKA